MNCVAHIVKYILYIFNLLFLVCGILLIVFGSLTLTTLGDFLSFSEATSTNTLPICVLTLGCIIFLVSFLGCCGAIKDNKCLVYSYSVSMLILLLLQLALIIYTWVARNNFLDTMGAIVDKAWNIQPEQPSYMDALQLSFKCCGQYGANDYKLAGQDVPNSCCGSMTTACSVMDAGLKPGCRGEFVHFWSTNTNIIRYAGLGVAVIELVAFIFGCFLAGSISKGRTV